jgi:hypothetical protein
MANPRKELILNVKKFEALQEELKQFGANDSEPRNYFWNMVKSSLNSGHYPNPTIKEWQLFEHMEGAQEAAKRLSHQGFTVFRLIQEAYDEEVEEFRKYYGV